YTISATVTDSFGNVVPVSTIVLVNPTALSLTITPPTTPPNAGLPAIFTVGVGTLPTGDIVRNVHIEWGDTGPRSTQDLGSIRGNTSVSHVYDSHGTYPVPATLIDAANNTTTTSTPVPVVAPASPTIIITPSVPTGSKTATFTIQVTPPTGVGVVRALLNFGDNAQADLGGLSGTTTVQHTYAASATYTVTLDVTDTLNRTTRGSTTV